MPPPTSCPDISTAPVKNHLTPELQQAMEKWLSDHIKEQDAIRLADKGICTKCERPMADKMADFALETQGASVVSTRCSETYRIRSACVTIFGFPLWYPSESPRTVIQGYPVLLPGKCWAFHGVQGTLVISLSHPIRVTHVTLDHLPRYNSPTGRIDSAPKDFEVYGMKNDTEEGTLLGTFTYDENGESTQTFELLKPSDTVYRFVELRVLSNWGHIEYTCLYRFRVHGKIAST
ncbi:SUN domain-containing protein 1-like [Nematolebias whitei]|uniref:SUN domain-containing protein 1-like n=1 Tax=Nematolebias whitei TaxID=451745 RepID=UPI0018979B03|nr:SUN domain-containing protein 1-like [Nematolebias whitei]